MNRKNLRKLLTSLFCAALATILFLSGLLYRFDNQIADLLYQTPKALEGNIFIVGIDQRAIDDLGPYADWERDIMAQAIEALNADPDCRPAAIGVDVLYIGTTEPDYDDWLADAAGMYDNVVTAAVATFGTELVANEGNFYLDDYHVMAFEEPFDALRSVTTQGHINAMYDRDGVLRHSILQIDVPAGLSQSHPEGFTIPSFAYALYQKYASVHGLPAELTIPTDSRHRFYVDFAALPGAFYEEISVSDLLAGEFPAELFQDAVVIIGPWAPGLSDYVTTAIDRAALMYGAEYQANVVHQMISGSFKTEAGDIVQAVLLFLIAGICLWCFLKRGLLFSTILWLVVSIGCVFVCKLSYNNGLLLHPLYIPMTVTVFYIGAVAIGYVREALEKRKIAGTFRRYVAPEIVHELLREGTDSLDLGGKLCDIAVLFVDIRGFTPMSELLTPEEVVSILNKYLTLTTECIMKNHGTLDKFVGDCTMAIWNAPMKQDDYVMNACKAALDMVEGSKALSEELMQKFGRTVSFGIGVHCGPAVVGNIGAEMRMDFTAIGDTVNTSARLEANAPAGKIYVSREIVNRLGDRILVTSQGDGITLKGKSQKFEIFYLDGIADSEKQS